MKQQKSFRPLYVILKPKKGVWAIKESLRFRPLYVILKHYVSTGVPWVVIEFPSTLCDS